MVTTDVSNSMVIFDILYCYLVLVFLMGLILLSLLLLLLLLILLLSLSLLLVWTLTIIFGVIINIRIFQLSSSPFIFLFHVVICLT